MEGTFGMIRNFFADGIFGNIIRFLFDRFFGSIFTTNINFSNIINLKNCHFKDLTIDAEKINKKLFKNGPFKLFSGKVGSISIKFPSLNALLTESLEVRLDRLDILLVMNDVDFSTVRQEVEAQLAKLLNPETLQNILEEKPGGGNAAEDLDVYKKIINRILFNIKLKVENVCVRIVPEKPYKDVRLPIAPCFMLKIAKAEVKKNFEQQAGSEQNKDASANLNFVKNQNYNINIYGITMHIMSNYELKPDEYIGKDVDPKAEFPFTYPNESHPSTIFVCACKKVPKSKSNEESPKSASDDMEPISIHINFSNDKSKSVDINIPNFEIMFDFLKIKFLSKYIEKLLEYKKYLDYKKALIEQLSSQKKSPKSNSEIPFHFRKGSFGIDFESSTLQKNKQGLENSQPSESNGGHKIRIAGYDIDVDYFQKEQIQDNERQNDKNKTQAPLKKGFKNVDLQGLDEIVSEPFELTAETILDTSNVHINLNLKSVHIYFLKSCTAFLETEFKRWWLYGSEQQTDLQKCFNKKIPISYFQFKLTKLNFSMHTKEGQISITFSSLQVLDVNRVDSPLNIKTSAPNSGLIGGAGMNKSQMNKSELFYSFRMDKSFVSGLGGFKLPDLKRNPTNDLNETSMLFQSAVSDITKDFLQMREVRKQILDWEIDPKKEHFCVNVIFKLNKMKQNYSFKEKKGSGQFKTVKYMEDSVIHSPLNTESLTDELPNVQTKPSLRLSTKGGKILASLDLPPVYVNFYMSLVHDINSLLHNASDSYKIVDNWYFEQNQQLLRKWEQELRDATQETDPNEETSMKKKERMKLLMEEVDNVVEAYFKRQNLLLNMEIVVGAPLIKIVFNLENPKKDLTYCFCGFSSHYFGENLAHNPIFKKEFVVLELCQLAVKVLKIPPSDYSYPQSISSKKVLGLYLHTLFQSLDIYIPSKMTDENKVLMTKLLSLRAVQDEGKMIIPSILIMMFEDHANPFAKATEMYSKNMISPWKEGPQSENSRKKNSGAEADDQIPFEFANTKPYDTLFRRHMNKNMASDLTYLDLLDEDSTLTLDVTFPNFEIYVSKQTLEFIQSFSSDWISLIEDVNEKLTHLLEQEKRLFSSIIEIKNLPSKAPQVTRVSLCIEEMSLQIYEDEKVNQNFQQVVDSKKNKINLSSIGSSIRLDDSFSAPTFEKNYSNPQQSSEIRCYYLRREFERALMSSFKIIIRHNEAIVYKNPREIIDIIHLEIQDLLIVDRKQEKVNFGSFQDINGEKEKEYYDEAMEYEAQECIVYKQTTSTAWTRPLGQQRAVKEPEFFKEWKNKGILILENTHQSFVNKNKNVLGVGILKSFREGRLTMEIEGRLRSLVLRSDFKLAFIDTFKDLMSGLKSDKKEKKIESPIDSIYGLEKKEIQDETRVIIQLSLDQILVDLNPYLTFDYCKTFGKINYNIDPESMNPDLEDLLFYSDTRSLVAIESLGLRFRKRGNKIQFDEFSLSSLDLFMRYQKGDSTFKENCLLLRSRENSFFEREFEELKSTHSFKSHPFYLSGLSINALNDMQNIDIKLEKIELNIYADTLPTIEKHKHLILCLIEQRKHKHTKDDQMNATLEEEKYNESISASLKEGSLNKPKDQVILEEEIEIEKDYFAPVEVSRVESRALDIDEGNNNEFDVIEDAHDNDDLSKLKESAECEKSFETLSFVPSIATSFVSSSTVFYFDEENIHDFILEQQEVMRNISFKLGEISISIFETYEFDIDLHILEVNFPQFNEEGGEPQNILINKENNKIERLPKCVNEKEKAECIMVVLETFKLGMIFFKNNENQRTNLNWRASVTLQNFEVLDCFKNSKNGEVNEKLLCKYSQIEPDELKYDLLKSMKKGNQFLMHNTFDIIVECFENFNCKQRDIRAFVAIHPLAIHVGVPHYNFGKLFLAKMNLKNPSNQTNSQDPEGIMIGDEGLERDNIQNIRMQKKVSEIFFSSFHFAPTQVKMNINLDVSVFNLDLFKDLKLKFPAGAIRGAENMDELKRELTSFYLSSVKAQLGQFVKDLPLLRNLKNLTNATLNLFYSPYMNYREGGNFLSGLKDGVAGFAGSVSNESVNLFTFLTTMLDNVTTLTGIKEKLNKD